MTEAKKQRFNNDLRSSIICSKLLNRSNSVDAIEKKQAARAEWERRVSYSAALKAEELDQILSDLDNGRPTSARVALQLYLNRSFETWYLAEQQAALLAAKGDWS